MSDLNTNPIQGEPAPVTEPAGEPTAQPTQPVEPSFTQEQVNGLVTKESRKQMEKLFSDVGLQADGDYKTQLEAFKKWTDSQKTEAEQAVEREQAALKSWQQEKENSAKLEMQIQVMGKGVSIADVDDYIALANVRISKGAETFEQALDMVMEQRLLQQVAAPSQAMPSFAAKTGTPPTAPTYEQRYAEAQKNRNNVEAIKIKQEAFEKGIIL